MTARNAQQLLFSLALAALFGCGSSDSVVDDPCAGKSQEAGTREIVIQSGGRERRMVVEVPESAVQGEPAPLVVLFHGALATPEVILANTRFAEKGAEADFITVAGAGIENTWNGGGCCDPAAALGVDDVGFTRDMIETVSDELCIDPERVFATGFSNGGVMTYRLACEMADVFSATAPVASALLADCEPARPAPILIIQNVEDPIAPFPLGPAGFNRFQILHECSGTPVESQPAANATCETAQACTDEATTELCAIGGISHVWPGGATNPSGAYDATDQIWDFFAAQPPCESCGTRS